MQALVLVGGEGTRLRPLTLTQPKPAIRLVDRPFIRFMVDWLGRHGVTEVVLACGFGADAIRATLGDRVEGGPELRYLAEPEALGTAGPIRLAADEGLLDERFYVLNGDVLTDLDLTALRRLHADRGAVATIGLYPVSDPASYGLVRRAEDGEVTGFVEKPPAADIDTDEVNAGAYFLERRVAAMIPAGRAVSIEREVFPRLVGNGLFARRLEGYWLDIGVPARYLQATWDILEGTVRTEVARRVDAAGLVVEDGAAVDPGAAVSPPALIERDCTVAADAEVGARAVLGHGCAVGEGARIADSVLYRDCSVGARATVEGAILAAGVGVGAGARIGSGAVIGEGASVEAQARVAEDARVQPGERVGRGAQVS